MENKDDVREMMPEEDEKAEFGKRAKVVFKKKVCKFCAQNLQIDYKNPDPVVGTEITIGDGFFGIMFPQDGHSPQHLVGKSEVIKKITVKVSI